MFVSSVIYYLLVRKVQQLGVTKKVYLAMNFVLPTILYAGFIIAKGSSFILPLQFFGLAMVAALVFNYIGSSLSYLAIQQAPNTGYSVIIQKSYAIYTTIASALLFGSEFSTGKFFIVLLIIFFTGLIIVDKKKDSRGQATNVIGTWAIYSIISLFLFGSVSLSSKWVAVSGSDPTVLLFWIVFITSVVSVTDALLDKKESLLKITKQQLVYLVSMALAVTVFYLSKNYSDVNAPNVGYSSAINASSNAALAIASAYFFKEELNLRKAIGVVGVIVGIVILIS